MAGTSGAGGTVSEGSSFNPPPLVVAGQTVGGGLNFTATNAVSQVDQASQAYDFMNNATAQAYSFVGSADQGAQTFALRIFQTIAAGLSSIGGSEAESLQTAAGSLNNQCSGFLGCFF